MYPSRPPLANQNRIKFNKDIGNLESGGLSRFPIFFFDMQGTLNVDINLIKRYSQNKRRKELFALAIWCHIQHVNATIFDFTVTRARKELSIGKAKAERLLDDAREDPIFRFNGTTIRAGSFRDYTIKYTRKQRRYCSAVVKAIKFDTEHKYALKELYNLINEILTLFPIAAKEDKDCLPQRGGLDNRCVQKPCDAKSRTLTLRKFCQNNGMSVSSCHRLLAELAKGGKIRKSPSLQHTVISGEHKDEIEISIRRAGLMNYTFKHNGLIYIIIPCSYSILSRDVTESYKHKIYGYHKDYTHGQKRNSTIPQLCGY